VIILEEAAHLKPALFHQVIVPLMTVDHTAFLAISSPGDTQNYYSLLTDLKNHKKEPLFLTIRIGVACDACVEAEKENCEHIPNPRPAWKTHGRHELVRSIYADNKELMQREAEGRIVSTGRVLVFPKKFVEACMDPGRRVDLAHGGPTLIHSTIDPSGGGGSEYVIQSYCKEPDGPWIVSIHRIATP
jgi:hypothetical protein